MQTVPAIETKKMSRSIHKTEVIRFSERRVEERFRVSELTIDIFPKNHPILGKVQGLIENISHGGLLFTVSEPFANEPRRLFVSLALPTGDSLTYVRARVVHTFMLGGRFAYGLAFFPLSEENKKQLDKFLAGLTHLT